MNRLHTKSRVISNCVLDCGSLSVITIASNYHTKAPHQHCTVYSTVIVGYLAPAFLLGSNFYSTPEANDGRAQPKTADERRMSTLEISLHFVPTLFSAQRQSTRPGHLTRLCFPLTHAGHNYLSLFYTHTCIQP